MQNSIEECDEYFTDCACCGNLSPDCLEFKADSELDSDHDGEMLCPPCLKETEHDYYSRLNKHGDSANVDHDYFGG